MTGRPSLYKDFANYLAGRGSLILLGFISFPLLTRLLPVSEYGAVSLTFRLVLLLVVLSKCGLQYSATRFFNAASSDASEQRKFYSTLLICPALISIAVSALYVTVLFCSSSLRRDTLLFHCLLLAPLAVVLRTIQSILLSFLRNEGKSRTHIIIEVFTKATSLIGFGSLVLLGRHEAFAVLVVTIAGEFLVVAMQLGGIMRRGLIHISAVDWTLIRQSLQFGVPLIAYELSSLVLDSADRLIVQRYLGDYKLGLYSAAYGISGYLQDTVMTPLNLALFPIYMRIWNEKGKSETSTFLSKTLSWFIVSAFFIIGASALCSRDAMVFLASKRFQEADQLLLILVPALMVYALHIFFNVGLILEKRTGTLALIALGAAIINIAANFYWVPRFELFGAAIATLISYVAMVAGLFFMNRSILPLRTNKPLVFSGLIAALCAYPLPTFIHVKWTLALLILRTLAYALLFGAGLAILSEDFRGMLRLVAKRVAGSKMLTQVSFTSIGGATERGAE